MTASTWTIMKLVWAVKLVTLMSMTMVDATCTSLDQQIVLQATVHRKIDVSTRDFAANDPKSESAKSSSHVVFPDVVLPPNSDFLDATLGFHADGTVVGHRMTLSLRRVLEAAKEQRPSTFVHDGEPSFRTFEVDSSFVDVDVTNDVETWIQGKRTNEGWLLVGDTTSAEGKDVSPILTVRYCPSSPLDQNSASESGGANKRTRVHKGGSKRMSRANAPLTSRGKKQLGLENRRSLKNEFGHHKKGENYFEFSWGGGKGHHRRDEPRAHHHHRSGAARSATTVCLLPLLVFGAFYTVSSAL